MMHCFQRSGPRKETPALFTGGLSTAVLELVLIMAANSFCQIVCPYLNFKLAWLWQLPRCNTVSICETFFLYKHPLPQKNPDLFVKE